MNDSLRAASAASFLLLTGCVSAPEIPDESRLSMADMVDRVGCEMKSIFKHPGYTEDPHYEKRVKQYEKLVPRKPADGQNSFDIAKAARKLYDDDEVNQRFLKGNFLANSAIGFELTLQVKDSGGIGANAASATWSGIPITTGLFSLKATGGFNGSSRRTATYKVSIYMKDTQKWPDGARCVALETPSGAGLRLAGNFGMAEWIIRAVDTAFARGPANGSTAPAPRCSSR